jgi:hypothetical protein
MGWVLNLLLHMHAEPYCIKYSIPAVWKGFIICIFFITECVIRGWTQA